MKNYNLRNIDKGDNIFGEEEHQEVARQVLPILIEKAKAGKSITYLKEWQKAKADLTTAKEMGFDIIEFFQNAHESVKAFEAKNGIKLPEDIAALLQRK